MIKIFTLYWEWKDQNSSILLIVAGIVSCVLGGKIEDMVTCLPTFHSVIHPLKFGTEIVIRLYLVTRERKKNYEVKIFVLAKITITAKIFPSKYLKKWEFSK